MSNKTLQNETKIIIKNANMNDMDYLINILNNEKSLAKNYTIANTEMSNQHLHKEINKLLNDTLKQSFTLFELLFEYGWYKLDIAEELKVNTITNEYENRLNEI